MRTAQLADLLRPESLDDLVGQDHLFGRSGIIRRMLSNGRIERDDRLAAGCERSASGHKEYLWHKRVAALFG